MPELPKFYPVWVDAENTRVYGIDNDDEGTLWFTGGLPALQHYRPKSGTIDTIPIPENHGGSQCLWVKDKVYILPQTHPRITVYHVSDDRVSQVDKPFPEANLWYGHADRERGLLYLPERSRPCLVVWDVADDRGALFPYPEAGRLPSIRQVDWPERLEVFPVPGDTDGASRRVYFDPEAWGFVAEDGEPIPPLRPGTEGAAGRYIVTYRSPGSTHPSIQGARMVRLDRQTGEFYEREVWSTKAGSSTV